MPKIRLKDLRPDHDKPRPRRLKHIDGRELDALPIKVPQDHHQVQRFALSHPFAKAFYFSTSAGSINTMNPLRLGEFFVIDDGTKLSAVARTVVEQWAPMPEPERKKDKQR